MAKTKQKKADKDAKPAKRTRKTGVKAAAKAATKLPKRIAGVKVPKAVRQSGEKLVEVVNHPIFADVVAASLVAAANALREDRNVGKAAGAALSRAAVEVSGRGNAIGAILTATAIDGISRLTSEHRGRRGPSTGDAKDPGPTRPH